MKYFSNYHRKVSCIVFSIAGIIALLSLLKFQISLSIFIFTVPLCSGICGWIFGSLYQNKGTKLNIFRLAILSLIIPFLSVVSTSAVSFMFAKGFSNYLSLSKYLSELVSIIGIGVYFVYSLSGAVILACGFTSSLVIMYIVGKKHAI